MGRPRAASRPSVAERGWRRSGIPRPGRLGQPAHRCDRRDDLRRRRQNIVLADLLRTVQRSHAVVKPLHRPRGLQPGCCGFVNASSRARCRRLRTTTPKKGISLGRHAQGRAERRRLGRRCGSGRCTDVGTRAVTLFGGDSRTGWGSATNAQLRGYVRAPGPSICQDGRSEPVYAGQRRRTG